jgi:hypothetical protein
LEWALGLFFWTGLPLPLDNASSASRNGKHVGMVTSLTTVYSQITAVDDAADLSATGYRSEPDVKLIYQEELMKSAV